jgi:hypothetical protein
MHGHENFGNVGHSDGKDNRSLTQMIFIFKNNSFINQKPLHSSISLPSHLLSLEKTAHC